MRREEGAEGEEAKLRIKLRRSASFQKLSPHRERTQSLFLSNNQSGELADESEAQSHSCSEKVTAQLKTLLQHPSSVCRAGRSC